MSSGTPPDPVPSQGDLQSDPFYGTPGRRPSAALSRILVILLVGVFLVGTAGFVALALKPGTPAASPGASGGTADASSGPSGSAAGSHSGATGTPGETGSAPGTDGPTESTAPGGSQAPSSKPPAQTPAPTATPGPPTDLEMPMVPVVGFWSSDTSISRADLVAALKGQVSGYDRVVVSGPDRQAIGDALGIKVADSVEAADPDAIRAAVKDGGLGVMRASDLSPQVRALAIDGVDLVGNERIHKLDDWPLVITVNAPADQAWDQGSTWTMVAGGDSMTDRGIYERVVNRHKGLNYPFQGGTARVTGHYCCGPYVGHFLVPSFELTGNRGVVRALTQDADLAVVNLESPVPDDWRFHLRGTQFSSTPGLMPMFTNAGIDWVSLANNHIKDYGTDGIIETRTNLKKVGLAFTGAGRNAQEAAQISYLQARGTTVAMVACVAVVPGQWAGTDYGGGLSCRSPLVVKDIAEADKKADVVVVFVHWGVEYSRAPIASQRKLAQRWVDAGADLILGAHSHVSGEIGSIDGTMVFYSLGNFIFDQNFRTETMESFLVELTWEGDRLVQARLHPFLSVDQAQPNLLDPATDDGKDLLRQVRKVSDLGW